MLKVTTVNNKIGLESYAVSLEVNADGYVLLPPLPDTDHGYILYAPLKGFETQGPWYFKRYISRREAKQARFTVSGLWENNDLCPQFCPADPPPLLVDFPLPMMGQEYWLMGGYVNGKTIPVAIVKC